jgi:flagellum-specific peptidoglycan hydrolase FlgJ
LICHSSTIAQAIVEGGWSKKEEEKEEKEDPSSDLEDEVDHD